MGKFEQTKDKIIIDLGNGRDKGEFSYTYDGNILKLISSDPNGNSELVLKRK